MNSKAEEFLRLKETIIRMKLDKEKAEKKAENIAILLKEALQKKEQTENELASYSSQVTLRKEKLKRTQELLQEATSKLRKKRQDVGKRRSIVIDLRSVDSKSGNELEEVEAMLKLARGRAGESMTRLQDAQKKHQFLKREIESCQERRKKAETQAERLDQHVILAQDQIDELRQQQEESGARESLQVQTITALETEIKQANNRTESANRERLVRENDICSLRKQIDKHIQEKNKTLEVWTQMGHLANLY